MNEKLYEKIQQKIEETISNKDEIKQIFQTLSGLENSKEFTFGILIGRLYNSFYYQSKRILNREPTKEEFDEFLEIIQNRKSELENLCL
ncbi:MAG: hypothetical protein R3327_00240 [Nitrosopumilaceae archaeon]|nr:hypothetical protein [Nitrosopumilaceae archaeon]